MNRPVPPPAVDVDAIVTEEMIRTLVHTFYGRVRLDPLIGPIFEAAISDWEPHLAKLCDFWSSVVLRSGRYKGMPMPAHAKLPGLNREHFIRWLALFTDTAEKVCPPAAAAIFIDRANRIAESLQLGIAIARGESIVPTPRSAVG